MAAASASSRCRRSPSVSPGARKPSATSPHSPAVAVTSTTRCPAAAARAMVPPQAIASSSGWAWNVTRVAKDLDSTSAAQPPAAADAPLEDAEEQRVDDDPDDEDAEHGRHQRRSVGELPGELEPHAERGLLGDDDDELAGHQRPPGEGPALLQAGHEPGERRWQEHVPVGGEALRPEDPAGPEQHRRDHVDP